MKLKLLCIGTLVSLAAVTTIKAMEPQEATTVEKGTQTDGDRGPKFRGGWRQCPGKMECFGIDIKTIKALVEAMAAKQLSATEIATIKEKVAAEIKAAEEQRDAKRKEWREKRGKEGNGKGRRQGGRRGERRGYGGSQ